MVRIMKLRGSYSYISINGAGVMGGCYGVLADSEARQSLMAAPFVTILPQEILKILLGS